MTASAPGLDFLVRGPVKGPSRRLVVLLHGYGRNAAVMEKMAEAILAELPDSRVVMPHAPEAMERPADESGNLLKIPADVRAPQGDDERQWFAIRGDAAALRARVVKIAARLNEFIDNQRDMMGITDNDVALMGFSQGGGVALYAALLRAAPLRCVVGHSTIFLGDTAFRSRPPVFLIHGDSDPEFSQGSFAASVAAIRRYADDVETRIVPGLAHTTSGESRRHVAAYIRDRFRPPAP